MYKRNIYYLKGFIFYVIHLTNLNLGIKIKLCSINMFLYTDVNLRLTIDSYCGHRTNIKKFGCFFLIYVSIPFMPNQKNSAFLKTKTCFDKTKKSLIHSF